MIWKPQIDTSQYPIRTNLTWGTSLRCGFVEEQLPHQCSTVEDFFRHRGAYARFKELLAVEQCLEKWYAFEAECTERALRDWCHANQIQLVVNDSQQSA